MLPRILQYFSSGWNIADLTTYLLTLVFQLFRIYWYAVVLTMELDVESDAYYGEFQGLAWLSKQRVLIICFAVILSWLKVSKFCTSFHPPVQCSQRRCSLCANLR